MIRSPLYTFESKCMIVFWPDNKIALTTEGQGARLLPLGGETLNGPRCIWWNLVVSSQEKIEAAKEAWASDDFKHGRFKLLPGDTEEFIPIPEKR